MNVDAFSQEIKKLCLQIQGLLQCNGIKASSQQDIITEAFEELHTAMEELLTASEELKLTRAAVEKERQRYQDLFEFAPDGYLVTNAAGIILEANYTAATLLGVHQKHLVGKPLIRIQQELKLPFELDGQEVFTTASIGIALSSTVDYKHPEELLRDADTAMYRAKFLGRARYELFNSDMYANTLAKLQLESDLRRAIERLEFRVYYQPIVSLTKDSILGFEALLYWQHPERGLLNPADFIPLAEETGLIYSIGNWALHEACRQVQAWRMCHHSNFIEKISVNLSLKQFSQPDLIEQIRQILRSTGLDASTLVLEITESVIVENGDKATAVLLQLQEMGIELSIDDFGTGYSSLGRLYNFPISVLKIDRSFISLIASNSKNLEIIEIIITLAHKLGMDVLAEGVETKEQLALLRKLNCEYAQGNFFSIPLNSSVAEALIMTNPRW
ncbi:MAG: EAL domain-containing protein [Nostoc indistinguendum CM1-VF10]|jgi:EAL domain-containing protein (putative c-di-GMP-specific phosphodiesterase class I)|nr:EAL domain-containing protein [Nostoc indistinguendum CM1-VF10]